MGIFLPTCPNWAMARRLAICSDMDRVPSASRSRQKRGPMVRLVLFKSLWGNVAPLLSRVLMVARIL
eukprot:scaffold6944_cov118-Isochrysis_galbana.AAC.10